MNHPSASQPHRTRWYWAFLIPLGLVIAVPFYNKAEPALWGLPFFYWVQLLFVVVGAVVTGIVYRFTPDSGSTMPPEGDAP